jgi:hypothetical protein
MPVPGYKNVRRLDVAVNNTFGVGRIQRVGDLDGEREKGLHFYRSAGDTVLQSHPVQKLHGNERTTVVLADFVDGADIWMVEGRSRTCLPAKAFQSLWVLGQVFR